MVHQDIDAEESAIAYFRSFLSALCRVIPAGCTDVYDPLVLAKEIHQLIHQMHGLVVFHAEQGSELESEYVCFAPEIPLTLIQELVSGQSIFDPEENILLVPSDKIGELDPVQYEVLGQVQEEGQLKDVLAAANIEFGAAASSRKARKHRRTASGEAIDEAYKAYKVKKVTFDLLLNLDPAELIDSFCKTSCLGTTGTDIDAPQEEPANIPYETQSYAEKMAEYDVLLTWFKILSQPDDVILKKISSFEDYEDRMKKLGAKLKRTNIRGFIEFTHRFRFAVTRRSYQNTGIHSAFHKVKYLQRKFCKLKRLNYHRHSA